MFRTHRPLRAIAQKSPPILAAILCACTFCSAQESDEYIPAAQTTGNSDNSNVAAMYELGRCYFFGFGVEENKIEAVEWFRKAAEAGEEGAQEWLREHGY